MNPKQRAAEAALDEIRDGMIVGLGSGSTAECFIEALGAAIQAKRFRDIRGVATSVKSEDQARRLGIRVITLAEAKQIDVTIDGADEIDPSLNLIKGLGGALLREKLVAQNSKRLVIIADSSKRVSKLGTKSPLPVEVVKFASESHREFFRTLGSDPELRRGADGEPYVTDNGNFIYDCRFKSIDQPPVLEALLRRVPGLSNQVYLWGSQGWRLLRTRIELSGSTPRLRRRLPELEVRHVVDFAS